jgi:2-oxoglutarate ferredoxin oxidoreductase subunit beta
MTTTLPLPDYPTCPSASAYQTLAQAIKELTYQPQRVLIISESHCYQSIDENVGYGIDCLPGQAIAIACGAVTANPALKVFVFTTADQLYLADLPQLTEALRLNHNLTVIAINSQTYGSELDESKLNPLLFALTAGGTFIARGFAGDQPQLRNIIMAAAKHDGLALVDVLQPRHISNQIHTYAWYRQRLHKVEEQPGNIVWPIKDRQQAFQLLQTWENGIATGLIYQQRSASYQTRLLKRLPVPLVDQPLKSINIKSFIATFK